MDEYSTSHTPVGVGVKQNKRSSILPLKPLQFTEEEKRFLNFNLPIGQGRSSSKKKTPKVFDLKPLQLPDFLKESQTNSRKTTLPKIPSQTKRTSNPISKRKSNHAKRELVLPSAKRSTVQKLINNNFHPAEAFSKKLTFKDPEESMSLLSASVLDFELQEKGTLSRFQFRTPTKLVTSKRTTTITPGKMTNQNELIAKIKTMITAQEKAIQEFKESQDKAFEQFKESQEKAFGEFKKSQEKNMEMLKQSISSIDCRENIPEEAAARMPVPTPRTRRARQMFKESCASLATPKKNTDVITAEDRLAALVMQQCYGLQDTPGFK